MNKNKLIIVVLLVVAIVAIIFVVLNIDLENILTRGKDVSMSDPVVNTDIEKEVSIEDAKKILVSSGFFTENQLKDTRIDKATTVDKIAEGILTKIVICETDNSDCSNLFISDKGEVFFDMTEIVKKQKEEEEKESQKKWILTMKNELGDNIGARTNYKTKEECFSAGNYNLFDTNNKMLGVKYFECGDNCRVVDTDNYDSTSVTDLMYAELISCEQICNEGGCK